MGGAVRGERHRRARLRSGPAGPGPTPGNARGREARLRAADSRTPRPARPGRAGGGDPGSGRGSRLRSGERAGARGPQARAARGGESGGAGRRGHRVLDLRSVAEPLAGRLRGAAAGVRRPPLQPGLSDAARRGGRRRGHVRRNEGAGRLRLPLGRLHPLVLDAEIDAFVADRLLEAVWREALHLINDGVATADEIDQAIVYGPRPSVECHGDLPLLPAGRRRGGNGSLPGAVRAYPRAPVDASGRAGADRRPHRPDRRPVRHPGGRPRPSGSWRGCATTA